MMSTIPIYRALAEDFRAEGVTAHFTLMGDGNMHWATAMAGIDGMMTVHARHEHCACGMAMGYHSATGKVGVASVTYGPGFTQIMTILTTAARAQVPLVVFSGETPLSSKWNTQATDQRALALACGAHYISAHHPDRMHDYVREAFYTARHHRKPTILGVPHDLQMQPMPQIGAYQASEALLPKSQRIIPHPAQIELVAEKLANARCPIILAGRGVIWSEAADAVEALAEQSGALLSTTLLTRGLYDHNPFSLGVCGGFARNIAQEMFGQADLIIAFGASLNYFTVDGGQLFSRADEVIQVDTDFGGSNDGRWTADVFLRSDAKLAAQALLKAFPAPDSIRSSVRTDALAHRIRHEPADDTPYEVDPGTLDPRKVAEVLEKIIPGDYDVISGTGHQSYFHTTMRGGDPRRYHAMRDFGAIGNSLSYAIGVAAARGDGKVVLFEGDGSLLMHIQELETIKRHKLKLLIVCSNDGAYGAEIHKLRAHGLDDSGAIFGRLNFEAVARSFGLEGGTVTDIGQFSELMQRYEHHEEAAIWNIHISDKVMNPRMKSVVKA